MHLFHPRFLSELRSLEREGLLPWLTIASPVTLRVLARAQRMLLNVPELPPRGVAPILSRHQNFSLGLRICFPRTPERSEAKAGALTSPLKMKAFQAFPKFGDRISASCSYCFLRRSK